METREPEQFRRHTAYHQAGHVIADLLSGYRFTFVTIRSVHFHSAIDTAKIRRSRHTLYSIFAKSNI